MCKRQQKESSQKINKNINLWVLKNIRPTEYPINIPNSTVIYPDVDAFVIFSKKDFYEDDTYKEWSDYQKPYVRTDIILRTLVDGVKHEHRNFFNATIPIFNIERTVNTMYYHLLENISKTNENKLVL